MWLFKKKEEPKVKGGFTQEEYDKVMVLCNRWVRREYQLLMVDKTLSPKEFVTTGFHSLITFNIIAIEDADVIFAPNQERRTETRFMQLYLGLICILGKDKVDAWSRELQASLIRLNMSKLSEEKVQKYFVRYPYLAIVPVINMLGTELLLEMR